MKFSLIALNAALMGANALRIDTPDATTAAALTCTDKQTMTWSGICKNPYDVTWNPAICNWICQPKGGACYPQDETDIKQNQLPWDATQQQKDILYWTNKMRMQPKSMIPYLKKMESYYGKGSKSSHYSAPGQPTIVTKEGVMAVQELIQKLEKARANFNPISWDQLLADAAQDLAVAQGKTSQTGHTGPDGSTLATRIDKVGKWQKTIGENIAYGTKGGLEIVLQLAVDDGVPSRGHYKNIMNKDFTVMGAWSSGHKKFGTETVIDYAGGMSKKAGGPSAKENYKCPAAATPATSATAASSTSAATCGDDATKCAPGAGTTPATAAGSTPATAAGSTPATAAGSTPATDACATDATKCAPAAGTTPATAANGTATPAAADGNGTDATCKPTETTPPKDFCGPEGPAAFWDDDMCGWNCPPPTPEEKGSEIADHFFNQCNWTMTQTIHGRDFWHCIRTIKHEIRHPAITDLKWQLRHITKVSRTIWRGAKKFGKTTGKKGVTHAQVAGYLSANWSTIMDLMNEIPPLPQGYKGPPPLGG